MPENLVGERGFFLPDCYLASMHPSDTSIVGGEIPAFRNLITVIF